MNNFSPGTLWRIDQTSALASPGTWASSQYYGDTTGASPTPPFSISALEWVSAGQTARFEILNQINGRLTLSGYISAGSGSYFHSYPGGLNIGQNVWVNAISTGVLFLFPYSK